MQAFSIYLGSTPVLRYISVLRRFYAFGTSVSQRARRHDPFSRDLLSGAICRWSTTVCNYWALRNPV